MQFSPAMGQIRAAPRRGIGSKCRSTKRASTARNMPSFVRPRIWRGFMPAGASVKRPATFSPRPAKASSGARETLICSKRWRFSPSSHNQGASSVALFLFEDERAVVEVDGGELVLLGPVVLGVL